MKNQYFILRHGQSIKNRKRISAGWPEIFYSPLTKKGEKRIKEVAKKLKKNLPAGRQGKINLIFSSDLLRAKQTALIVAKELKLKPKFDKRLREVKYGIFNGKTIEETGRFWDKERKLGPLKYYSKRFKIPLPGGEDYSDIEKRMFGFLKEIGKKYQGKNILIVGHQRPLTLLEKTVYGYSLKKFVEIIRKKKEIRTGEVRKLKTK